MDVCTHRQRFALRSGSFGLDWVRSTVASEKLQVAADNGPDQRVYVRGLLRDRLAEGEGIAGRFVGGEVEMVGSDCRTNGRPASLHSFHSRYGSTMLEHDAQL